MVSRYQKRISGPLLDRIDIHVEVALIYGLRAYGKLLSDRMISVDRNHVLEFWRDCMAGCRRWFAVTYASKDETWDTGWGNAISMGVQQERIMAGATIKRVFIVDDESEYEELEGIMQEQTDIGIEVKWLTREELQKNRLVREHIDALGTVDVCLVDDSWVFRTYLDRTRRITYADAIKDSEATQKASFIFNEAFDRGRKVAIKSGRSKVQTRNS